MNLGKYTSDKRKIGVGAALLFLVFSIGSANGLFVVPSEIMLMLGGITATWLATEGYMDAKRSESSEKAPESSVIIENDY